MPAKTISQLTQATTINNADEFAIEQSGVTKRIAASVVRGDIANANISASAAIDGSKLANSSVTPTKLSQPYTLATAQNSTSGTSIDFTGIPSWVKRVTVMFDGVSTSGTNNLIALLGAGSVQTSGYSSTSLNQAGTLAASTSAMIVTAGIGAAATHVGMATLSLVGANAWVMSSVVTNTNGTSAAYSAGRVTLSGTLDRVRITTVNGTDTFDAGTINIAYEG